MKPKQIAFMGGGVLGIAEAGAFSEIDISELQAVAGTSAGAINACLVAMKYTPAEIKAIINACNFASFKDANVFQAFTDLHNFGIYKGNAFLTWIKAQIKTKTGNELSTFADFNKAGFLDLSIYATNLNTKSVTKFSFATTPNVAVCDAVRCSMSIPLFFEANELNGQIYVDGGLCFNYPIETWDGECPDMNTLGICFSISPISPDSGLKYGQYLKYVESMVESLLNSQYVALSENPDNLKRSIVIDSKGISPIDFDLSSAQQEILYQAGRLAALIFNTAYWQ